MNFLIYLFWLIVSIAAAVLVDKFMSPSQVIYTIAIYLVFIVLFGVQKKTYVKTSKFKLLKWDIYSKFELIEQSHILGIPLGSGTVLEVQKELLSDKEVSEFVTGKLVPLAFHLFAPKLGLAARLALKKK
ncbi:MAG: hypothetical protein WC392_07545 [Sulfuricella sp.]